MRIFRSCFYFFSLYSRAVFQGYFTNKRNRNELELHSFGMVAAGVFETIWWDSLLLSVQ